MCEEVFSFIWHKKDAGLRGKNLVPFIQKRSKRDTLEKRTFAKLASINSNEMLTQAFKCICLLIKDKPFMFILRQWTIWFGCDLTALSENYIRPNINILSKSARRPTRGMPNILFIFNALFSCMYKSDEGKKENP